MEEKSERTIFTPVELSEIVYNHYWVKQTSHDTLSKMLGKIITEAYKEEIKINGQD